VIAIVGPTASGKTEWGLKIAREQNGEIISVDSRQVYQYLTVGTAKPEKTDVPYHLIDFLEPSQTFSAADFSERASTLIRAIQSRGKTPILVGGTGFYFRALTEGLADLPTADETVRTRLRQFAEEKGRPALHARLAAVDPQAALNIPAGNIQRVIRALEVFELTGKPISVLQAEHRARAKPQWDLEYWGLDPGVEALTERITKRCAAMLKDGMIEETQLVLKKGYAKDCPGLSGLGYPHIVAYLEKRMTLNDVQKMIVQDTRQYAKRQRTWFKHQTKVIWKKSLP